MTLQQVQNVIMVEKCGSFSEAAKKLFISQPSISAMVKDLEQELGRPIFIRNRQGVSLTPEGKIFLKYAYQIIECQNELKNAFSNSPSFQQFSVSPQHYGFVVDAFVSLQTEMQIVPQYDLQLKNCTTREIIDDVVKQQSEIGIIYLSSLTKKHLSRLLKANHLEFNPLKEIEVKAFLSKKHPLAKKDTITLDNLLDYPCITFDQGEDSHIYYAEDSAITLFDPAKRLRVTDLAASARLVRNCNAYNIGSGILGMTDEKDMCAIPVAGMDPITLGWISIQNSVLSATAKRFIELLMLEIT